MTASDNLLDGLDGFEIQQLPIPLGFAINTPPSPCVVEPTDLPLQLGQRREVSRHRECIGAVMSRR
ncbi:hypothetical protein [Mesorhizobium sp. M7A.F.Ca.US.001.02.1.1]|uniref:hypothetical protein n=1 Tax=Mesorhizobium sp. M7A.F.Ca.US.001.02.1.1 TaxID=2496703 RepID=UPI000FEB64B1|nr:hypothetical protein [Mesorhizobium sp. M7A.F.Ca.US.001.02.1.1]